MDLIIMAAGLGSRFGSLKQIKPIDENGNFIIDYSIYDAIKAGFSRVVFIIKKENFEYFDKTIGKRIKPFIEVDYAFQDINSFLPNGFENIKRQKPWGTAHAILCAKNKIKSNFAVINADDFYGREAFIVIYNFLKGLNNNNDSAMVGYKAINTISQNGEVKRGVCKISNNCLTNLEESVIRVDKNKLYARPLYKNNLEQEIEEDTLVSMNFFGLNKCILNFLEEGFKSFLNNTENLQTKEYLLPTILTELISKNLSKIKILKTNGKWLGLTYKEDFDEVFNGIKQLKDGGIYPKNLWEK